MILWMNRGRSRCCVLYENIQLLAWHIYCTFVASTRNASGYRGWKQFVRSREVGRRNRKRSIKKGFLLSWEQCNVFDKGINSVCLSVCIKDGVAIFVQFCGGVLTTCSIYTHGLSTHEHDSIVAVCYTLSYCLSWAIIINTINSFYGFFFVWLVPIWQRVSFAFVVRARIYMFNMMLSTNFNICFCWAERCYAFVYVHNIVKTKLNICLIS